MLSKNEIFYRLNKLRKDKTELVLKMVRIQGQIKDLEVEEEHLKKLYYEIKYEKVLNNENN